MLKRLAIFSCCFYIFSFAQAAEYWSVGSFANEPNAKAEQDRLSEETGLEVTIGYDEESRLYRVLVEKDDNPGAQKRQLEAAGNSPWTYHSSNDMPKSVAKSEASTISSGDYMLVVAGFRNAEPAQNLAEDLSSTGVADVSVMPTRIGGNDYFRVVQGPFSGKNAQARQEMIDRGYDDAWWATHEGGVKKAVAKVAAKKEPAKQVAAKKEVPEKTAGKKEKISKVAMPGKKTKKPVAVAKPTIRAPRPGESYFDYCVSKANQLERAVYCGDGSFNDLVVAERRIVDRDTALLEFCALRATASERRKFCGD